MNTRRAVVVYSFLRIAIFAAFFALTFFAVRDFVDSELTAAVTAAIVAGIAGMSLSYIVLRKPRERIAEALYEKRKDVPKKLTDDDFEDSAIDQAADSSAEQK